MSTSITSISSSMASTNPGASKAAAGATASGSTAPVATASSIVTLSPQAGTYAQLAADGITSALVPLDGALAPPTDRSSANMLTYMNELNAELPKPPVNGTLSEQSFDAVAEKFGAAAKAADQLFQALDTSGDGTVTNAQVLKALGDTASDTDSSTSQSLLKLMGSTDGGVVSGAEFIKFETALVFAEQPGTAAQSSDSSASRS